ncbi:conserved hypothetical protein [Sporisorium reilianum SRZ2]|uniref:Large ribosomal subunit protein uL23m n=1 Tax=Sporisorium reilianum (strain SRZ2) TaxID=999809 RepID=E6ZMY4_SPORE|nr:conserved hypothetical protein [Sporisorium reilianum SRZ2]
MISAPSSQALLARTAFRGAAAAASRLAVATPAARTAMIASNSTQSSRSFAISAATRQAVEASIPTPSAVEADADAAEAEAEAEAEADVHFGDDVDTTSGRRPRAKDTSDGEKANLLQKWGWFEPNAREIHQLRQGFRRGGTFPTWLRPTFELVKSFRSARARLWVPTVEDIRTLAGSDAKIGDVQHWTEKQIEAYRKQLEKADAKVSEARKAHPEYISQVELWDMMDYEQQVDFALRELWKSMSDDQRAAALLRTRFESIRKLGWRQGYSSGYPRPEGESSHLPAKLGARGEEGWAAFRELQQAEEKEAWAAWQQLSPEERVAEEKAAWKLRDRSQVYLDDSEDSLILGSCAPRWYAVPERAGELTFLPNTTIKLVKNHTPAGHEYDAFKATFRVPLSMHKHALRACLLAIYGLTTTWARSSIYRSPVTRDNRTGKKISGRGRTYKKVEVGLLEPFLFPEVSPEFKKQHLLTSELDYEQTRVYLKMTKTTRWRGKKTTEQYEGEIANRDSASYHQLDPLASEGIVGDAKKDAQRFPRFMVKTKGLPSAKNGKILEMLSEERKVKEARVNALIEQFRRDTAVEGGKAASQ